jgi:hypothetical protein
LTNRKKKSRTHSLASSTIHLDRIRANNNQHLQINAERDIFFFSFAIGENKRYYTCTYRFKNSPTLWKYTAERFDHTLPTDVKILSLLVFLTREEFQLAPFEVKSWPHLVGTPLDEAVKEIQREHPGMSVSPQTSLRSSVGRHCVEEGFAHLYTIMFSTLEFQMEPLALYSPMKMDSKPTRVRIFFDEDNNVARVPQNG